MTTFYLLFDVVSSGRCAPESLFYNEVKFIYNNFTDADYEKICGPTPEFCWASAEYHVTTVKDFLLKLYGPAFEPYLMLFPDSTLEGLVNASNFVNLPNSTCLDSSSGSFQNLPLPNDLFKDESRFVIDRALLKYGLTKQCAFSIITLELTESFQLA